MAILTSTLRGPRLDVIMLVDMAYRASISSGRKYRVNVHEKAINAAQALAPFADDVAVADTIARVFEDNEIKPGIEMPWGTRVTP